MNFESECILILTKYQLPFTFSFEQMIEFIMYKYNGRLSTKSELSERIKSLTESGIIQNRELKHVWFFDRIEENLPSIGTVQNKKTDEIVAIYFEKLPYLDIPFSVITADINIVNDKILFNWDNNSNDERYYEEIHNSRLKNHKDKFYETLYEILKYFKY